MNQLYNLPDLSGRCRFFCTTVDACEGQSFTRRANQYRDNPAKGWKFTREGCFRKDSIKIVTGINRPWWNRELDIDRKPDYRKKKQRSLINLFDICYDTRVISTNSPRELILVRFLYLVKLWEKICKDYWFIFLFKIRWYHC